MEEEEEAIRVIKHERIWLGNIATVDREIFFKFLTSISIRKRPVGRQTIVDDRFKVVLSEQVVVMTWV